MDQTWLKRPKADAERPHDFYNPKCGIFALCRTWELFCLFHPREFLPLLLARDNLDLPETVEDCCWSYEFKDDATGKLVDLTLHAQLSGGADLLLAGEAKFGGDTLKQSDRDPATYLDNEPFRKYVRRRMLYIVHRSYVDRVKELVNSQGRHSIITWEAIYDVQLQLAGRLPAAASAIKDAITLNAYDHKLQIDTADLGPVPEANRVIDRCSRAVENDDLPVHIRNFAAGLRFHVTARSGRLPEPPFGYLKEELSCRDVHRHMPQHMSDHVEELWRLD